MSHDYGHPLRFGTSITPRNDDPQRPVALAQLSEQVGLDLVTAQDHPYQPRFLDTWTLLSWIAGSTERIHLAPNVLNVPMRMPSVLARSAASLDLLSHGRVELGLGAGGFWDAMASMGVDRLTPGEAVDALEDAIDILRGMWDLSRSIPLTTHGTHHRVDGAERGPAPAHRIPLAIGAKGKRMLQLIGREGDGWILPGGQSGLEMLDDGNRRIDDAATSAGRDPREIRRILNLHGRFVAASSGALFDGPWEEWVDQLVPLAVDGGLSTFILAGDDPDAIETFATRVAPAVRERVAAVRAERGTAVGSITPLRVRARRRAKIAYNDVPADLKHAAVEPGDVAYGSVRSNYIRGGSPGLVLRPKDADEVAEAVRWAQTQPVVLSVRSGGHGFSGRSTNDGGIIIDLARLHEITVLDEQSRLVRIEPGARWGEVARVLRPHGWALSSGDAGGVGVGGLGTAGGIGFLGRAHGLTIDHVRAVELVLADGSQVRASATEHPDLFWALRGAGFAFGVVTAFEFQADEVGDIGFGQLTFDVSDGVADFLVRWGAAVEASPRDTTSFLTMGGPQDDGRMIAQTMNVVDSDDPDTIIERLQRIADTGPLVGQQAMVLGYDDLVTAGPRAGHKGVGEPAGRSALLDHITPEFAADAERLLRSGASYYFQIRSLGGATTDVAPGATAFAHRDAQFAVLAMAGSDARIDAVWDGMRHHFAGIYLSFETDRSPDRLQDAFPPETLARLRALKRTYDPDNVFRDNFNLFAGEDAAAAQPS